MAEAKAKPGVDIDKLESDYKADPSNFVPLAKAYMERNLAVQAIQVCKEGLRRAPQVPDGQLALAMAFYLNYDDGRAEIELKKVLKATPDNSVAHRTLGEIFLERKQEQKAIGELMRALELEPSDPHTRSLLESLNEKVPTVDGNGQPEQYWLPRQLHVTKVPPKPLWHAIAQVGLVAVFMLGFLLWYNHHVAVVTEIRNDIKEASKLIPRDNFDDLIKAEEWLNKALVLDDGEERALVTKASVQANLFEHHGQADRLDNLKKSLVWMKEEELLISERYGIEGLLLIHAGKAEEAQKLLSDVITRAVEKRDIFLNATVFGVRGAAYKALGKMQEAREDYSRAAKFSSLSPHYQALFADVYLREGNLPRARRYAKDAIRKNPDHVHSNLRLAFATIQTGKNLDKARKTLDTFLNRDKHSEKEFSPPLLSMLYTVRGEYALIDPEEGPAKAKEWVDKAIKEYDNNAEAHNLNGRLAAMDKDGAGALAAFAKALQIDPRLPKVYFDRAESMFALDQKAEAVDKLKEFERALPATVTYYVMRGDLLMRMDKLEEAKVEFEAAIKTDELDPKGRYWLARTWQAMGDKLPKEKENEDAKRDLYNKAREEYENAVMLPGGETPEIYHHMGLIYASTENYENALDNLAKSVMMFTKAGEPPHKIAAVYTDISKIFGEIGGDEGEKQRDAYQRKAKGLIEGKTIEEVEKDEQELQKQEVEKKKKKKKRRKRRRRSR